MMVMIMMKMMNMVIIMMMIMMLTVMTILQVNHNQPIPLQFSTSPPVISQRYNTFLLHIYCNTHTYNAVILDIEVLGHSGP